MPKMTMRATGRCLLFVATAGVVMAAQGASAQTVSCAIAATPMAFGVHDPSLPERLGPVISSITVQCSVPPGSGNVSGFTLNLSLSTGGSGTYAQRAMTGTRGGVVSYNIYTSASAGTIWGDGNLGSAAVTLTLPRMTPGQSGRASAVAYGFVPGLQDVAADDYADTIMVIANW